MFKTTLRVGVLALLGLGLLAGCPAEEPKTEIHNTTINPTSEPAVEHKTEVHNTTTNVTPPKGGGTTTTTTTTEQHKTTTP